MVSLANRLRKARKQAGYTQEQLAERIGVSRAAIARYEAGEIEPSLKVLLLLAETLSVSTDSLLGRKKTALPSLEEEFADLPPTALEALISFIRCIKDQQKAIGMKQEERK